MKQITLHSTEQIKHLFGLLSIKDEELNEAYYQLSETDSEKMAAVKQGNYDKASELRHKELMEIKAIVFLLNEKKFLENNSLNVIFLEHSIGE